MKIIISLLALFALAIAGYFLYQLYVVPKMTRLPIPDSYPKFNVAYKYFIQPNGLYVNFGNKSFPASEITSELEKDMKAIKSAGFNGISLDYYFNIDNYYANRIALRASQQGLYPIGILHGYQKPEHKVFTPELMAQWQKYVRDEVSANKNIIYFWEIWNEPNVDLFKYGTPEEFVELMQKTYPIIKEENPNAKVIATLDMHDKRGAEFTEKAMELGAGNYTDILSVHPYAANPFIREDIVKNSITEQFSLASKFGNHWQIIIGEIGQPTSEVSEEEQARLAKFVYTEAQKNNLPITWFYWSDARMPNNYITLGGGSNWGLNRSDETPRPILETIKEFLK